MKALIRKWLGIEPVDVSRFVTDQDLKQAVIDSMLERLDKKPEETYEYGDLEVETKDGLRVVTFNR